MEVFIEMFSTWFKNQGKNIVRFRWLIIIGVLLATLISIIGIKHIQTDDSFDAWLLEGDPLLVSKEKFKQIFGNSEYIVILAEQENIFSKETLEKIRELSNELESNVPLVDKVTSITNLDFIKGNEAGICIDELIPDEIPDDKNQLLDLKRLAETKPHLKNRIFNTNGKSAAIVLRLVPYPEDNTESYYRIKITEEVYKIINKAKYSALTLTPSGMPVVNHDKGIFYKAESATIFKAAILIMLLVLALSIRSIVGVIAPAITAICSILWVFGIQGFLGTKVQSMVVILPALLLLVVAVGYSIHVFSFFNQHFREGSSRLEAIEYALYNVSWPIFLTVITTVLGFLSFLMVPISAIRWIGVTSAALVAVSYPLVIIITPALLSFGKNINQKRESNQSATFIENFLVKFGEWVLRNNKSIGATAIVVTGIFMAFLPSVEVNTDIEHSEGMRVPYVQRVFKVANDIGSFYSYDCSIELPEDGMAKIPENLKKLDKLSEKISISPMVKRTRSITDIIKDLNSTMNADNKEFYTIPDDPETLAQLMLLYEMSGGSDQEDWVDYDYRHLRLTVELKSFNSIDYLQQVQYIKEAIARDFPGSKLLLTGSIVVFTTMIDYMLYGQLWSIVVAMLTIGLIMAMLFGSLKLGIVGMIPNIIPLIFVGGTMGMMGIPLNFMTIMVSPMILGIAVDDTIHFITHFKISYNKSGSIKTANLETFKSVGLAMFLTSVTIILGFIPFGLSLSIGYVHMCLLVAISVISALLADYLITPNLISWSKPMSED